MAKEKRNNPPKLPRCWLVGKRFSLSPFLLECSKQCIELPPSCPTLPVQPTHEVVVDTDSLFWQTCPSSVKQSTICRESPTHQLRHFVGIAVLKRRPTVLWLFVLQGQTCLSLGFVPNLVLKLLLRKKFSALFKVLVLW